MANFMADAMASFAKHGTDAQPLLALCMWLHGSGRVLHITQFEGDPDMVQAMFWADSEDEGAQDEDVRGEGRALWNFAMRPGPAEDLGYWMAGLPACALECLSCVGQDGTVPLTGFAAWTPPGGATTIVHLGVPGAYGAVLGSVEDFLRALSAPIGSLAEVLQTGAVTPARPNEAYCAWLQSMDVRPAETLAEALPALRPANEDPFRDWLRDLGYEERYFLDGHLPDLPSLT